MSNKQDLPRPIASGKQQSQKSKVKSQNRKDGNRISINTLLRYARLTGTGRASFGWQRIFTFAYFHICIFAYFHIFTLTP